MSALTQSRLQRQPFGSRISHVAARPVKLMRGAVIVKAELNNSNNKALANVAQQVDSFLKVCSRT